jgi:hypothetical protein
MKTLITQRNKLEISNNPKFFVKGLTSIITIGLVLVGIMNCNQPNSPDKNKIILGLLAIAHAIQGSGNATSSSNPTETPMPISASIPVNAAQTVSFTDQNIDAGLIQGLIQITKALSEADITHYVFYFGSSANIKLGTAISILPKTGANLTYPLPVTSIPIGATHILVRTKNTIGEMGAGVSIAITDNIFRVWTQQTTGLGTKFGRAVAIDSIGNIYTCGDTSVSLNNETYSGRGDLFVAKYSPTGQQKFLKLFGSSGIEICSSIALASDGLSVYISGLTSGNLNGEIRAGGNVMFVSKISSVGDHIWTRLAGTAIESYAHAIAVDSAGNIVIAGYTGWHLGDQIITGSLDAAIQKYDSAGTLLWTRLLGTTGDDRAGSITIDAQDNIYVTGYTDGNLDGNTNSVRRDAFVTKFTSSGVKSYTKLLGITLNTNNFSIANSGGKLYLAIPTKDFIRLDATTGAIEKSLRFTIETLKSLAFLNDAIYVSSYSGGNPILTKFDLEGNIIKTEIIPTTLTSIAWRNGILVGTGYIFSGADANYTLDVFNP